jgi:hypothetical protein
MMTAGSRQGETEVASAAGAPLQPRTKKFSGPSQPEQERFVTEQLPLPAIGSHHRLELVVRFAQVVQKCSKADDSVQPCPELRRQPGGF